MANTKLALRGLIDTIKGMATASRLRQIADSRRGQAPDMGNKASRIDGSNMGRMPIQRP